MTYKLGPWVRLEGVSIQQLPPGAIPLHGASSDSKESAEAPKERDDNGSISAANIFSFITSILAESIPFIDGVAPKSGGPSTWKAKGAPKKFPTSKAPVHLCEWTVPGAELDQVSGMSQFSADRKDEYWCCRKSVHRDVAETGTATWREFVHNFKDHHAESERDFTPTVMEARKALEWDTEGIEVEVNGERWDNITMVLCESKHKIDPKPLKNRTFPVVQVTAMLAGAKEFLVISIPLTDFDKSPYSKFAKDKSLVIASYTSIERVRVLPDSGDIEWIMATASNAKGVLPQFVQNMAVPGAIAKDVEFFMSWIPTQRASGNGMPADVSG
ncbi:hypothetical protein GLAREA_00440 [Glarea lozoyensis ATCC 20868]|uniref:DUF3074 domain-containing protein n=1 Tax=Glarea lozoyensis (strain ATCC 20868 / MF5171) TaxID=1116229 RepID=S3CUJ2_GLAL2|nr:uncharacterized protein GLAREA_00440 [Glarea lozoyensis ATCC 20868]EPE29280.1 hypothetical protein GLAREA_00440 [Glarea lozoyensis ATCC 20868]